jgi:hypothetical protein
MTRSQVAEAGDLRAATLPLAIARSASADFAFLRRPPSDEGIDFKRVGKNIRPGGGRHR